MGVARVGLRSCLSEPSKPLTCSWGQSQPPSLPPPSSLENLDVSWAWLEAKDLRPLHRAVEDVAEGGAPFLLRRLDMSNNTLDDAAVKMLISLFDKTEQTIEQVRLEGNRFTREGKKALGGSAAAVVNDRVGKGMMLLL